MDRLLRHRLLALYDRSPRIDRLFVRVRLLLSDLDRMLPYVPASGHVLDIGCGHGLVANLLALSGDERQVLGVDLDPHKVAAAQATIGARRNVQFAVADAAALPTGQYRAVTIADVMYLIPPVQQRAILASIARALEPGGVLVWKSQTRAPRWKYAVTYAQEWLMTHLGPTAGAGLYFMDEAESLAALSEAGLRATALPLPSWRPYTDVLFVAYRD